ncbi:hypothetical protein [Carboxylicivirga caseinilyticus]|uniref:hypothetical protein n=1 Tax=Carboxylicivirga caseinilyticus TaxID=3417572 RepID=UPI003D33D86F|nr:hypothetical protein [Marinilabiliaceae bacterium A049]
MALAEINRTINWIDQEIRDQQTGTPNQLAGKLSMSVRMLYFYLDMMRALGADITYCKTRMTFEYAKTGHFINGTKWVED